jgi:hypothetical protein
MFGLNPELVWFQDLVKLADHDPDDTRGVQWAAIDPAGIQLALDLLPRHAARAGAHVVEEFLADRSSDPDIGVIGTVAVGA